MQGEVAQASERHVLGTPLPIYRNDLAQNSNSDASYSPAKQMLHAVVPVRQRRNSICASDPQKNASKVLNQ